MFLITWVFDKLGYMPKVSIDANWPFPAVQKPYVPHEFEQPAAKKATKVAKKTATVKIPKATTRKTTKK
jgi:hypothetical protein